MRGLLLVFVLCFNVCFAKRALIIGVSGGSGSGKTTIAQKLHKAFPDDSIIICQDSYYRDLSHLSMEERDTRNFDHPDSIEFSLMADQISSLTNLEAIEIPQYDFTTHTRKAETETLFPRKILIIEGLMLLAMPEIRELLDIKLYVDTPEDIRLIRRLERDQKERGRTVPQVLKQYLDTVRPMHIEYIEPSKRYADVIIPEGGFNQTAIDIIISKIREELANF